MSPVDYEIRMHDKRKQVQNFHINLLKTWCDREALFGEIEEVCLGSEATEIQKNQEAKLQLGEDLTTTQREQMRTLEGEFKEVFSVLPGRTDKVEHQINTPTNVVVRSGGQNWPYHL